MFTVNELLEIAARSRDVILFHRICDEYEQHEEKNIGVCDAITAKQVAKNPSIYYGAEVTNYSAGGVKKWKIFYSDGENIYLIARDYIPVNKIPATKSGNKLENADADYPKAAQLTNAVSDLAYSTGSGAIDEDNPARKWIASYLDKYSSNADNMKAVAYMMDTSVWNIFKGDMAEYALGGPTIDMLFASYNNKYSTNYQAKATYDIGYKISTDGGENWSNWYDDMLSKPDSLYVITSQENALGYFLASPSAGGSDSVMNVDLHGHVSYYNCVSSYIGFRPAVCLKSNISLTRNDDGSVTLN